MSRFKNLKEKMNQQYAPQGGWDKFNEMAQQLEAGEIVLLDIAYHFRKVDPRTVQRWMSEWEQVKEGATS